MDTRRQEILDFMRDKSRDEVEAYAQANGLETHNCSRDRMENQVADLLSNKYTRANGRQSAIFMANGKLSYNDQKSRVRSPRNLEWQNQVRSEVQSGRASNAADAIKKISQSNGNYTSKVKSPRSYRSLMSNGHIEAEIDQMAQEAVMKISGDNTLTSVSEWAEAVRYLAGKKLQDGSTITAVQATQSLKPYYVTETSNSNGCSSNKYQMSKTANSNGCSSNKYQMNKTANSNGSKCNKYQMNKTADANGCHNEGVCAADTNQNNDNYSNGRKYQNSNGRKSPRSLGEVLADSGVNVNDRDKSSNKWLMTIKDCTNKTGLDAVECAAILSKENNDSPYKEQVMVSARRKIQSRSPRQKRY